jgi:hypothetical protein
MRHWRHYLEGSHYPIQVFSDHKNLEPFMSTKVLNCHLARWAQLLTGYDFVLIHLPSIKNPADGPSHHPDYVQDVPIPTGSLLPPRSLRLLPLMLLPSPASQFVSNALFASLVGLQTALAIEPNLQEQILQSLPLDVSIQ